ncbi:hypothetical protein H9M94_01105 [Mycoplasma sp. Pen4]|uniref:Mbov_0398 family ICE element protein n=1 Tax=Mycoplasma sp. Pen4 TaxID=640330 RepID=UPI0016545536|nr:hypothetical protein [Mycoplasma sp. Pen4]QNM93761.1 hypothetical protein H9M94_00590 [Mycoplasma sp. Pen4]QNM93857.1 hypothetical protein H9M94_01105 [Mycoplasma sp. Pen4]
MEKELKNELETSSKMSETILNDAIKIEKAKKKVETKKKRKKTSLSTTVRFYNASDIVRLKQLQIELKKKGETLSNFISEAAINAVDEIDKEALLKTFKNDMFYSFRKAFYASLVPFSKSITQQVFINQDKLTIIESKLDLILDALTGKEITSDAIQNINNKVNELKELREQLEKNDSKAIKQVETRYQKFVEYDNSQSSDTETYRDEVDDEIIEFE